MTIFNSFVGTFGLLLLFTTGVSAWVYRSSTAPLGAKLIVPACLILLAVMTPFRVLTLMGYPMPTAMRDMPPLVELLRAVPYDDDKRAYLWLREGNSAPRAYDILMTDEMKKTLRQAQSQQDQGNRVMLSKKGKFGTPRQGYMDIDGGDAPYTLEQGVFALPSKNEKPTYTTNPNAPHHALGGRPPDDRP